MAHRDPLHQSADGEGQLVPGVKRYKLPLLPFERELIELAGITEDEYRYFVAESLERAKVRPAEYDLVPDIAAGPFIVPILINLAIGLVMSAISYLLTPKPKQSSIQRRDLASITGQSVFAPTSGFDSLAALANYNEPIPLIFGRYTGTTGGILISPKLVWSRAFSYGIEQGVKLLFVVGEQGASSSGITQPDLTGIFLGNSPLDAAFDHKFAFYWRSGTTASTSRIKAADLRYGTRGTLSAGDPENNNDVFYAPVIKDLSNLPFCMAYAPTSNAQFGAFSPVFNATDYRVPWKLVPTPNIPDSDADPRSQLTLERIKIAGQYGIPFSRENRLAIRNKGQAGIGRAYSRRMGVTTIDGFNATSQTAIEDVAISVGSTCVFTIHESSLPPDLYQGDATDAADSVQVGDINGELESQRYAADSILQIGETIQIGHTLWLVYNRSLPVWQPGQRQSISLRCIEILDSSSSQSRRIGRVGFKLLESGILSDGSITQFPATDEGAYAIVPTTYYPLMRTQIATIRNTRPCDVTEIGIRSQVWNRASGLCNFQSLPTPTAFRDNEINRVAITSGTITQYFKRTSVFALQLRPAGNDPNGNPYAWVGIGINLCVTGDQPTDLYNYIKIEHPERRQYEFRLVPRTGADVIRNLGASTQLLRLDARIGYDTIVRNVGTPSYGVFRFITAGDIVTVQDVRRNPEFEAIGRTFENNSQLADVSHYNGSVQKSNESQPEHAISYVNEITINASNPQYTNMVTAGLAIKASRTYASIDQIRVWKDNGIPVQRFHPDDGGTIGPSNLLTDLVYYLLTDSVAGAGASVSAALIKTSDFANTARFLRTNKLFFDGAIVDPINIREFITSIAPFFLCNFVISDGLLSLVPAVPTTNSGGISTAAVPISAMFTQGNIIEDTFRVEYINSEERNNIQAVLRYREGVKNQLPQERTVTVRWNDAASTSDKIETFDLTQYCTSRDHAILVGRFLLSVRRRITHTVTLKTTPQGLSLSPGDYIRVITTASPYSGANNGVITETGTVVSALPLSNASYPVTYYKTGSDTVQNGTITVSNGTVANSTFWSSVFTVTSPSTSSNVYIVEQLSLDAEGMVEIVASEFPCTTSLVSQVALDLTTAGSFIVDG